MRTFHGITGELESSGCVSLLSLWGEVDNFLIQNPVLDPDDPTHRSAMIAYLTRAMFIARTQPTAATAIGLLLALRPPSDQATGQSYGRF